MISILKKSFILISVILSGCATNQGNQGLVVNDNFYKSHQDNIQRAKSNAIKAVAQKHDPVYAQPRNKKITCKLPYAQEMLQEPGFAGYWDGACSKGMASGFGLDVAHSDIGHYEELTSNANSDTRLYVLRDYVQRKTFRGRSDSENKIKYGIVEDLVDTPDGKSLRFFNVQYIDDKNQAVFIRYFDSTKSFTRDIAGIDGLLHVHLHFNLTRKDFVTDIWHYAYVGITKGVAPNEDEGTAVKIRYANGITKDFIKINGEFTPVTIKDQKSYWGSFNLAYRDFEDKINSALNAANDAVLLEEKYDYKVKSGKTDQLIPRSLLLERSYYYKDFLEKERISINALKEQQKELEEQIRQEQLHQAELQRHQAELRRIEEERRAARRAADSTDEWTDFVPMAQPFQMQMPTLTVPQVAPLTINRPNVYTRQRINDNMSLIRKVR